MIGPCRWAWVAVVVVTGVAGACGDKKAAPRAGSGSPSGSAGAGSGTGAIGAAAEDARGVDATTVPPAVVDVPLPGGAWATKVPPYRLDGPPRAVWADDKRAIAAVTTRDGTRIASVDLATGAVAYGAIQDLGGAIVVMVPLASGELVGIGGTPEKMTAFTVDRDALTVTPRASALSTRELKFLDRGMVLADGSILVGSNFHSPWLLSPDLATAHEVESKQGGYGFGPVEGGKRIVIGGGGAAGDVWSLDPTKPEAAVKLSGAKGRVAAASGTAAVATTDKGAVLFDATTGAVRAKLAKRKIDDAAFSADGATVFVHDRGDLVAFDVATGAETKRVAIGRRHWPATNTLVVASPRRIVCIAGAAVRVVDVETGAVTASGPEPKAAPAAMTFAGADLIVASESTMRFAADGKPARIKGADVKPDVFDGRTSPSGTLLALVDDTGITVFDLATGAKRRQRADGPGRVAVADDGALAFNWYDAEGEATVVATAPPGGAATRVLELHPDSNVAGYTPDARTVLVDRDGVAVVRGLPDGDLGKPLAAPDCKKEAVFNLADDGAHVAVSYDKTAIAWEVASGKALGHVRAAVAINDAMPVPGSTDVVLVVAGGLALWDPVANTAKLTHVDGVNYIALDPGGLRVAVAFTSGRIAVYEVATLRGSVEPLELTDAGDVAACDGDPLEGPGENTDYDE